MRARGVFYGMRGCLLIATFFTLACICACQKKTTTDSRPQPAVPTSCDTWLGGFAVSASGDAALRIEKVHSAYMLSELSDEGDKWVAGTAPLEQVDPKKILDEDDADSTATFGCALARKASDSVGGIILIRSVAAVKNAPEGSGHQETKTGYVLLTGGSFNLVSADLYPVSPQDLAMQDKIRDHPPMKMGQWDYIGTREGTGMFPGMLPATGKSEYQKLSSRGKICWTPKTWHPQNYDSDSCSRTNEQLSGRKYSVDITCSDDHSLRHTEMVFDSDVSGQITKSVTISPPGQSPKHWESTGTVKFKDADCDDNGLRVKPDRDMPY